MNLLLGIDLGSTSIKAILYDPDGNVVARGDRPMRRFHPNEKHPEWTVWDPEELWRETSAACREAMEKIADAGDVKGIAVTGMGMDGLPMTEEGGRLYPLISWHDPRTQPQYEWWIKYITAEKTYAVGGNPVWAINSALRMLWVKEHEREIFDRTYKWLLIEDYINYCLSGVFATDYSMASCTMLFDQRKLGWSDEMCNAARIPRSILPDVHPATTRLGEVTQAASELTGLKVGTPVYLGGHDHLCSSLPVGVTRPGSVLSITGTWEMIDMVSLDAPLDTPLGKSGITTQANVAPRTYMVWGGNPSGEMLEWYRRSFSQASGEPMKWETMIALAEEAKPGCGGVLFLPHLGGSSCPDVNPQARGAFVGINTLTTQADFVRSVFEGLDYQLLEVVKMMEGGTRKKAAEVVAVGGAIRNKFWMQNKANMLGLTVRVPEVEEATVLGAAILAGIGAGVYRDVEDAFQRVKRGSTQYVPDEKITRLYEEIFPIYRETYAAVCGVHRKIFSRTAGG